MHVFRAQKLATKLSELRPSEQRIIRMMIESHIYYYPQIADNLGISVNTVKNQMQHAFVSCGTNNLLETILLFYDFREKVDDDNQV
jgi:DNA-binding CsgD family transcriptional regulator